MATALELQVFSHKPKNWNQFSIFPSSEIFEFEKFESINRLVVETFHSAPPLPSLKHGEQYPHTTCNESSQ